MCVHVCVRLYTWGGFYAAKTVVLPAAKRTINFRALVESLFHSRLWNQCRELRLARLELCSISYQLIVLVITTTIASICTHTYKHTHSYFKLISCRSSECGGRLTTQHPIAGNTPCKKVFPDPSTHQNAEGSNNSLGWIHILALLFFIFVGFSPLEFFLNYLKFSYFAHVKPKYNYHKKSEQYVQSPCHICYK